MVAKRIILHAALMWYSKKVALCRRRLRIEQGLLLWVTKCYNTVSADALNFLSGILPMGLRAELECDFEALSWWRESGKKINHRLDLVEIWKNVTCLDDLWRILLTMDLVEVDVYRIHRRRIIRADLNSIMEKWEALSFSLPGVGSSRKVSSG